MAWISKYLPFFVVWLVAVAIIALVVFAYKLMQAPERPVAGFVAPPPASGMPVVAKESVKLAVPLKVHSKQLAVKKMKLPPAVADNPAKQVTATAALKPSPGGYTVASVIDTGTGITELVVKEKPRPLFGFGGTSEIGLLGGVTTRGDSALVFVRQDLLRIGNVHVFGAGGAGVMGGDFAWGGFVGASVRW
jgi:hypothetical protein